MSGPADRLPLVLGSSEADQASDTLSERAAALIEGVGVPATHEGRWGCPVADDTVASVLATGRG